MSGDRPQREHPDARDRFPEPSAAGPEAASAGAAHPERVLVLVDGRTRATRAVVRLLAEQLGRGRSGLRLDVRRDPRSMLRVVTAHPRSLDDHVAVIAITSRLRPRRRGSRNSVRVAERAAAVVPTLLVQLGGRAGSTRPAPRPASWPVGYDELALDAGMEPAGAAGRVAVSLQAMILRTRPPARPGAATRPPSTPLPSIPGQPVDDAAMRGLVRIVRLTREAFDLAGAEINVLDERYVTTIASAAGRAGRHLRADSLCDVAVDAVGLTVVPDTLLDHRTRHRAPSLGPDAVRFYAAHPITSARGEVVGTLCVHDPVPQVPEELDLTLLRDLALLVEGELVDARRRAR